jgi:hypothetical protein
VCIPHPLGDCFSAAIRCEFPTFGTSGFEFGADRQPVGGEAGASFRARQVDTAAGGYNSTTEAGRRFLTRKEKSRRDMVTRTAAGAVLGGSLLVTGGLGIASAVPANNVNDQLVNLSVGNANFLHDVNVDVAAQIAGLLCGTGTSPNATAPAGNSVNGPAASGMATNETTANAGDIAAQARQVDAGQIPTTTCNSSQGVVTISQNGPANSPNAAAAPGQQRGSAPTSTAPAPEPAAAGTG